MTTYHESFPIQSEQLVRERFQNYVDIWVKAENPNTTLIITDEEKTWLDENLAPEVSQILGKEVHVILGMVVVSPPNDTAVIHVDGNVIPRVPDDPNWALNIPLHNCEEGKMTWYGGDYKLFSQESKEGLKWIGIIFNETPVPQAMKVINEPTLIRIDVPHNVENYSDSPRLMLTVRFTPDLKPQDY